MMVREGQLVKCLGALRKVAAVVGFLTVGLLCFVNECLVPLLVTPALPVLSQVSLECGVIRCFGGNPGRFAI